MRLDDWLRQEGLTQAELAARLGTTQQAVSRYCAGRLPAPRVLRRLHLVTGGAVTPNDFFDLAEAG